MGKVNRMDRLCRLMRNSTRSLSVWLAIVKAAESGEKEWSVVVENGEKE